MMSNTIYALGGIIALLAVVVIVGVDAVRHGRQFMEVFAGRDEISACQFYDRYYRGSGIALETVEGTLSAIAACIGCNGSVLRPEDNLAALFEDLDVADVVFQVKKKLRLTCHATPCEFTVDAFVRFAHACRPGFVEGVIRGRGQIR
jgi:hypothetical protein